MKLKYFLFFCLSVYVLSTQYSTATVRYVSKTGTSTPPYTSWATAADSIQKCINICSFGDTVYVANGVYKENLVINTAISLIGSSMDSTVIDGLGLGDYTILNNQPLFIENFRLIGKGENTVGTRCIQFYGNLYIKNCQLSEAGLALGSVGSDIDAENLIMHNLRVRAFSLYGNGYNKIFNCSIILDNENSNAIEIGFVPNADYHINNNIILFAGTVNQNPGYGISIGAPQSVYINNNLISGFRANIFMDIPDSVFFKNNLLENTLDNSNPPSLASIIQGGGHTVVNNVILTKNTIGINNVNGVFRVDSDYNLFWQNETNLKGVIQGNSDFESDPMFVKDTLPTANGDYDFHLQAYSPAIDKGDPNILDLDGSRSDIGLYGGPFGETYTYQDLAPLAPRNLSAIVDTNTILVKWNRNTEADNSYYNVYRDTVIGFQIDSTKLVSSSADTFFVQANPRINTKFVYKITCVDNQGNESLPSNELVVNITSVSTDNYPMTVSDYVLYQNYPNPFNPSTKIGYQLKQRAYIKLMVYDIKGELVSVLVNKEQNADYYEVEFTVGNGLPSVPNLASGIYLYRIEVIGEGNIPIYTEMKKMILIK
ncbi:MAG TPA: hypothetical protein PL018_12980 [Ignavibacteriaceae bacterium]|nr:hypothetical protein [Ignavibacteriaceae bacterium]